MVGSRAIALVVLIVAWLWFRRIPPEVHAALPAGTRNAIAQAWLQDASETMTLELADGSCDGPVSRLDRLMVTLTSKSRIRLAEAVDQLTQLALQLEDADADSSEPRKRTVLISMLTDPAG